MNLPPTAFFAALFFGPVILFAEARDMAEVPSREEADATIAAEMRASEARKAERKVSLEAVPAIEEWEVDHGDRKTILRRVASREAVAATDQSEPADTVAAAQWTEAQFAAWIAEQAIHRTVNLSATVFDRKFSQITWRDKAHKEWKILSNIDFRYLGGIGQFEDETHHWVTFLFVDEVDTARQQEIALLAAEKGFPYEPRKPDPAFSLAPADFLSNPEPEYIVIADSEGAIPAALYEELDAVHRYYEANEERLIATYKRQRVMNGARQAWKAANPPEPKDSVINFWKVH